MKTDSPPGAKIAEQSDENISRYESFKKKKEKLIGEKQKAH